MNLINEDLRKLKIDVQTNSDKNFLELAILFDKPEFLKLLPKLRKKYDVTKIIDIQSYDKVLVGFENNEVAKLDLSIYDNSKELTGFAIKNNTSFESIAIQPLFTLK